MAGFTIEPKLRPCYCYIAGYESKVKGLFHCWSFRSDVIPPSPMIGGHSGVVVAKTSAIVELEDGSIVLVSPENVTFVSGIFEEYTWV